MVTVYRTVLWLLLTGLCYGYCFQDCAVVTASRTAMVTVFRTVLWLLFSGLCYGYCLQDCAMVTVYRTVLWLLFTGLCYGYCLQDYDTPSSFFPFILPFSDPSFLNLSFISILF